MKYTKLLPLPLLLSGCATMMSGSSQLITINSSPANANVWVDNNLVGRSPISVNMKRDFNHIVRLELEGYQPCEMTITRELNEWVFGNIVFGGFIGLAVDGITGSLYKLTPEQATFRLQEENIAYSSKTSDSCIAVVLKPDASWEKIGQLTPQ